MWNHSGVWVTTVHTSTNVKKLNKCEKPCQFKLKSLLNSGWSWIVTRAGCYVQQAEV